MWGTRACPGVPLQGASFEMGWHRMGSGFEASGGETGLPRGSSGGAWGERLGSRSPAHCAWPTGRPGLRLQERTHRPAPSPRPSPGRHLFHPLARP